jgi:hypothetical protein
MKGILCLLLYTCSLYAFAQGVTVKGKIIDGSGEALIGVTVQVQGTTVGTTTDVDGNFTIPNIPTNAVLEVSYVGMRLQTIPVNGRTSINITLEEDTELLEEIVVVGYGTMRKNDVTGSLAVVSAKELSTKPVANAFEALQGKGSRCGYYVRSASRRIGIGTYSREPFFKCNE